MIKATINKKALFLLLTFILIFSFVPSFTIAASSLEFDGGNGTPLDPYRISTAVQLNNVRNYLDACFLQTADIAWDSEWMPIGVDTTLWTKPTVPFTGTYDGGGHTISGIEINSIVTNNNQYPVGFFGHITGSVRNLGLVDCNIYSSTVIIGSEVGGIAGISEGSIDECFVTGKVINSTEALLGSSLGFTLGAIAGKSTGTITNCYSDAQVEGSVPSSIISSTEPALGGIVGSGNVTNSYFTGTIKYSGIYNIKGITGYGTAANSYATSEMYDDALLTEEQMKDYYSFKDWNFKDIWVIDTSINNGFPQLIKFVEMPMDSGPFSGGYGFISNPYKISTPAQMNEVKNYPNCHFVQTNDIDLTEIASWTPIGTDEDVPFTGSYNGNGFLVKNMKVNKTATSDSAYAGLFGYIGNSGHVQRLGITGGNVTAKGNTSYAGGIAGYNGGTVELCYYAGASIKASSTLGRAYAGGLIGNNTGILQNAYNTADILALSKSSYSYSGGVVGYNITGGSITDCYTTGTVSASGGAPAVGGVVAGNGGNILNTYYLSDQTIGSLGMPLTDTQMKDSNSFSNWNFSDIWTISPIINQGYPVLSILTDFSDIFTDGNGKEDNPFKVSTASDLNNIRYFPNSYFLQTSDIDMTHETDLGGDYYNNGIGWIPIETFSGTYDGGSYNITGLRISGAIKEEKPYIGLFGYLDKGILQNIKLHGGSISISGISNSYVGAIVGYINQGYVENCENSNNITVSSSPNSMYVGGICGISDRGQISNCKNKGNIDAKDAATAAYAGGIVSLIYGAHPGGSESASLTITQSSNSGNVRANSGGALVASVYVGGIAGKTTAYDQTGAPNANITMSSNTGNISGTTKGMVGLAGGIAGESQSISDSYNWGTVDLSVTGEYNQSLYKALAGGIVGLTYSSDHCYNVGILTMYAPNAPTTLPLTTGIKGAIAASSTMSASDAAYRGGIAIGSYSNVWYDGMSDLYFGSQKTSEQMKQRSTYSGWDFENIWGIGGKETYPYHKHDILYPVNVLKYDGNNVTIYSEHNYNNVTAWIAAYDSNGRLTDIKKSRTVNLTSNAELTIPLSFDLITGFKIFIWTEEMKPLCEPWTQ